jgi:6-phosphogluconate dehydrogenase
MNRDFAQEVMRRQNQLRAVVSAAVQMGVPVPALADSLSYFDGYRSGRLPANLIQAQRDYFGSHTYERTDAEGTFHTQWRKN